MASLTRYSNSELVDMPDCRGLLEDGKCRWLNVITCIGSGCPYCKTTNNNEKVHERLQSLDERTQTKISRKYYGGTRPWMDTIV